MQTPSKSRKSGSPTSSQKNLQVIDLKELAQLGLLKPKRKSLIERLKEVAESVLGKLADIKVMFNTEDKLPVVVYEYNSLQSRD